ncbi:MAG: peptidoglycan DD-metalloendopeptidase family protein [Candidatus Eremiobacteraeota bacterium]|nr:peptidoglycan DD-metalloendopeptidase family protein [Candidatus Eremiobacteraeota bacterium]
MTRQFIAAILALSILPASIASASSIDRKIRDQQTRADQLHERLHEKRGELHAATVRVGNLQSALAQTNAAIDRVNGQLDDLDAQQRSTQRKLEWNTLQLDAARKTLKLHDDLLKHRLVDIYERGDLGYLNVLLSAGSFTDFVERWHDLRLLIAANERAVKERKAAERKVATAQSNLVATQQALQQQAEAQSRAKNQLDTLAAERRNLVDLADAQRRHIAGQVAEIEGLSAAQDAALQAMIVERQREVAAQEEAARRAAGIAGVGPPASAGAPGSLAWPVTGTITSPFGWRRSPFGGAPEFHQGLDIAANMGTTITAPAAGTVIFAGWYGGYGNYVLIDHGGGMATGYGHLSQILVGNGQQILRGAPIGLVGSTGASTGPHLHFEVRINGKPVDPAAYLH